MEHLEFKNLINHLIDVGLHFEPKDVNKLLRIWYPVLNKYSDSEVKKVVRDWLLQKSKFPSLSELLQEIETRRLGISDVRMFLYDYQEKKDLIYSNYSSKMKGKSAREKRELVKERNQSIDELIPIEIKAVINAYGGKIEKILKYNLKEFKASLMLQVQKNITNKNRKLLEG